MKYSFSTTLSKSFSNSLDLVKDELTKEGFDILTEIDVQATFKRKLNVNLQEYRILEACNPAVAYQAMQIEDQLGTILPCTIIIREINGGEVEVSVIDPVATLQAIANPELGRIARQVRTQLISVIDHLSLYEIINQ